MNPLQTEQVILGRMLADGFKSDAARAAIEAGDFLDPVHARIFAAMLLVRDSGRSVTPATVAKAMSARDLEEVGGKYVHYLLAGVR